MCYKISVIVAVYFTIVAGVSGDSNNSCTTPNGEKASCVPITSCPAMNNAAASRNATWHQFAKDSHCGFQGKTAMVCCGTLSYYVKDNVSDDLKGLEAPSGVFDTPSKQDETKSPENDSFNDYLSKASKTDPQVEKPTSFGDGKDDSFSDFVQGVFDTSASPGGDETKSSENESENDAFDTFVLSVFNQDAKDKKSTSSHHKGDDDISLLISLLNTGGYTEAPQASTTDADEADSPIVLKDFETAHLPDRSLCGVQASEDRIFGGEKTDVDEFPWMAALEYRDTRKNEMIGVRCGGSVISHRFVLTAAHCLSYPGFELVQVRLGEWNLTSDPDCSYCKPVQIFKIAKKIAHPYYGSRSKNNDIALIRLDRDITFNEFIRPICLPPENLPPPSEGTLLTVAGWGLTEHANAQSEVKLKVKLPIISNDNCTEVLKDEYVQANQICAGGDHRKDACRGDSGGPLVRKFVDEVQGRVQWYQEAVVSRGLACGLLGYPGIYTRLSRYLSWILHNIEA